jgi:hypothetical protein
MNIHICGNNKAFYTSICTRLHGEQLKRIRFTKVGTMYYRTYVDIHVWSYGYIYIEFDYWYSQIWEYADVENFHTRGKYHISTPVLARMN